MSDRLRLRVTNAPEIVTARHRLAVQLDRWSCARGDDGLLVFSELVANAVRHGGGAARIDVVHGDETLRFEVHDRNHDAPVVRDDAGPSGGFGLRIVARISDHWGWTSTRSGKVVWCDVPCCP